MTDLANQLRSQIRALEDKVKTLEKGHLWQALGEVTLTNGSTSTTVEHHGCSTSSVVVLIPTGNNSAAELRTNNVYVQPLKGSFKIWHSSSAVNRILRYIVFTGVRQ